MAPKVTEMGLVLILVVMLWAGAKAQSGCTSAFIGLAPCLNFVTGNSTTPSSSCCSQLSSVVQSQPRCLCALLSGGGPNLGITINQTLALSLPGACNVQTPPVSRCNGNAVDNGPASAPADSPTSDSPADSPSEEMPEAPNSSNEPVSIPSGGSKAVPSTNAHASDGSSTRAPLHLLVFLLSISLGTSIVTRF